jgi:site-specific recombinase XerD
MKTNEPAEDLRSLAPTELAVRVVPGVLLDVRGDPVPAASHPWLEYRTRYANERSFDTLERSLVTALEMWGMRGADPSTFPWWWLRRTHVQALRLALVRRRFAPATTNRVLAAVRGVLRECFRAETMTAEDYAHASDVENVDGSRELAGRMLEPEELVRMHAAIDASTPLGARDEGALSTVENTGLRREETVSLDLASLSARRDAVQLIGKGNRQRTVPLNARARAALGRWIAVRGEAPGPLFHPASPSGAIQFGRRLSYSGMQAALLAVARRAGVGDVSMHDFRRTLISNLLDEGTDIATVAKIVGHRSVDTTARYDRRKDRAAKEAVERHGALVDAQEKTLGKPDRDAEGAATREDASSRSDRSGRAPR